MLNKNTLKEITRIKPSYGSWFNPRGLHVDSDLNIYTIAISLDRDRIIECEALYCLNVNGHLLKKIPLKYDNCYDFQIINCAGQKKIILVRGDDFPPIVMYDLV